jgi:hypothetical protein
LFFGQLISHVCVKVLLEGGKKGDMNE